MRTHIYFVDLDFIRAECYVYSHIADEGLMNGCAGELMRYRASINAQHVSVLTDIKKKHRYCKVMNNTLEK